MPAAMKAPPARPASILRWESEGGSVNAPASRINRPDDSTGDGRGRFSKLRNDDGLAEILLGMKEFECIGVSPPHDHPHVYLNMGLADSMLCPYCATAFHFAPALSPDGVSPANCLYR